MMYKSTLHDSHSALFSAVLSRERCTYSSCYHSNACSALRHHFAIESALSVAPTKLAALPELCNLYSSSNCAGSRNCQVCCVRHHKTVGFAYAITTPLCSSHSHNCSCKIYRCSDVETMSVKITRHLPCRFVVQAKHSFASLSPCLTRVRLDSTLNAAGT
jgi:hypothetical protein